MAARDKMSPFIATSAMLHVLLVAIVVFVPSLFPARTEATWGASTDKGARVGVTTSLPGIPLPSRPVVDEAAKPNDSKTLNPVETAPKAQEKVPEKAADVKVPSGVVKPDKTKKDPDPPRVARGAVQPEPSPAPPNAVPGGGGQLNLPYGSAASGASQASFGDVAFGSRFPDYVTNMTRAIDVAWRDSIVGAQRGTSPRVYVTFTIDRAGNVSDLKIAQGSGSSQLDNSAQRAVLSARLPRLPVGYSGTSVEVRFYFEYTR